MKSILLFEVNIFKAERIAGICREINAEVKIIPLKDYTESLAVLAGIKKSGSANDCQEIPFGNEMMVIAGFSPSELDEFLQAYNKNKIPPIQRKAVLTGSNLMWNPRQLYKHLEEHMRENK